MTMRTRISTAFFIVLLAVFTACPVLAQLTYDENKSVTRNLVDVLIHLVNSGGTLQVGGAIDVAMNGDLDVAGDIGAGGDITITAGDFTITLGNAILTDGDLTLTDGDLILSNGDATISGELTWGGDWVLDYADASAVSYTLQAGDKIVGVSYSATGASSVIIPTLQMVAGRLIIVKDTGGNANPNTITVYTEGAETIDGNPTAEITTDYGQLRLLSNGVGWFAW